MNERIRLLAEQAYEQKPLMVLNPETYEPDHKIGNGGVPMYNRVFNQEKFAQLIVRECANIADIAEPFLASDLIKQHFGIEERKGWVCPKCGVDRTRAVCPKGHTAAITGDCPMTATAQSGVEE